MASRVDGCLISENLRDFILLQNVWIVHLASCVFVVHGVLVDSPKTLDSAA